MIDLTNPSDVRREAERRQRLRAQGARTFGDEPPIPETQRQASVREKEEQAAVIKLFREHGFTVRSTSQARPSKIAIGFPDLFVTHKRLPLGFFWETKRQVGGVVSEAQQEFGEDCWRCGFRWYSGDRFDAQRLLDAEGVRRTP